MTFCRGEPHLTQDIIQNIKTKFSGLPILPVIEKMNFFVIDSLFQLNLEKICFQFDEFDEALVFEELQEFIKSDHQKKINGKKQYLINFYENKDIFFIDLAGPLKLENLKALKLKFTEYLEGKIKKLKGIVYIFENTDENTLSFNNIWALFRFWKDLGVDFHKVYYLSNSEKMSHQIKKYVEYFGVNHASDLLSIVKALFPETKKMDEMKVFEIASSLLQSQNQISVA
ncbi:MAG: hypothetical protein MJB14_09325 [Spirochaetes bacterium]|nr:hypothetical protein [Spirochaetota bacterium]